MFALTFPSVANAIASRIWVSGLYRKFTKERREACNQKAAQLQIWQAKVISTLDILIWIKAKELGKEKTCIKYIDKKGRERVKGSRSLKSSQSSPWYLLLAFWSVSFQIQICQANAPKGLSGWVWPAGCQTGPEPQKLAGRSFGWLYLRRRSGTRVLNLIVVSESNALRYH